MRFVLAPEFKKLVTFIPNKIEPIHNWYYFKEGYSKKLVDYFIDRFQLNKKSLVLDPFCGVGTTLLACKQRSIRSIGYDVSPLFVFVSKVKTANYDLNELKNYVNEALGWKFQRPRELTDDLFLKKAFSRYSLEDIFFYKNKISEIEDKVVRDFLLLALMDSAIKGSYTIKDGAVLKIVKQPRPPVGKLFKYKIKKMLKDLIKSNLQNIQTIVENVDSREIPLDDNTIDAVITSPPYLNKIEYTKIYRLELSLFFGLPETELRSYIGSKVEDEDIEKAYFKDLRMVFEEIYRVCKENSNLAIVIGGGCFPDRVVETDKRTAEIAKDIGFDVKDILIARNSWCTRARTIKVGQVRESIITMKK